MNNSNKIYLKREESKWIKRWPHSYEVIHNVLDHDLIGMHINIIIIMLLFIARRAHSL